jgi:hypothetical protein
MAVEGRHDEQIIPRCGIKCETPMLQALKHAVKQEHEGAGCAALGQGQDGAPFRKTRQKVTQHGKTRSEFGIHLNNAAGPWLATIDRMQCSCQSMLLIDRLRAKSCGRSGCVYRGGIMRTRNTLAVGDSLNLPHSHAGNGRKAQRVASLKMFLSSIERHGHNLR